VKLFAGWQQLLVLSRQQGRRGSLKGYCLLRELVAAAASLSCSTVLTHLVLQIVLDCRQGI